MSLGLHSISLKNAVLAYLTNEQMSKISIDIGYDIKASFLPNEFNHLIMKATEVVLKAIESNKNFKNCKASKISPIVKKKFETVCNVSKSTFPEFDFPVSWRNYLTFWINEV